VRIAPALTQAYLDFLPVAERHAAPSLLLLFYCLLSDTCRWSNDPQALIWAEKAAGVARAQQDDLALVIAAAQTDISRVTLQQSQPDTLSRLETHLAYLEATPAPSRLVFEVLEALQRETMAHGDFEQSLIYGRRLQNMSKSFRNMYGISIAGYGLADTSIRLGRPAQAAGHLLDVLDWHIAIARVWQTLGCLMSICMFAELLGYEDEAAAVLSMAYHHPEALRRIREEFDAVRLRLLAALGAEAFAAAWERGQQMDYDTAIAQVRLILGAYAR
jgi:hypothetical protein